MARFLNIATISYGITPTEQALGLDSILQTWENLIDQAVLDRPDLILLPEYFAFNGDPKPLSAVAEDPRAENARLTGFLGRKAKQHKLWIAASYPRLAEKKGHFYNSAVILNRRGEIEGIYNKTFPTIGEMERGVIPGNGAHVFDTEFGRIGVGICFDLNFRELFIEYRRQKAELFCFLSAWPGGLHLPIMAYENQMYVAGAISRHPGMIVNPVGRILAFSDVHQPIIHSRINLDFRVLHIDYNNAERAIPSLKACYKEKVSVEVAGNEAVYLISSAHEEKSVEDMMREFNLESRDNYLLRSRTLRERNSQ